MNHKFTTKQLATTTNVYNLNDVLYFFLALSLCEKNYYENRSASWHHHAVQG